MNMEDRLRQAFEQEAEHLHAPSGSPETAIRRGRRRRASNLLGGAALVVALIGGTAVGVQVLGDSEDPDSTSGNETTASQIAPSTGDRAAADGDESVAPPAADIEFDWEQVTLNVPAGADIWNIQVAAVGDRFVAVANGHTGSDDLDILAWTSDNGRAWERIDTNGALEGQVEQIFSTGEGFVAVVRQYGEFTETTSLYTSPDGVTWTRGEAVNLDPSDEYTFSWFSGAAAGGGTTVVTGALQTEPPQPPIVFEERGLALERRQSDGGYDVFNLDTGEVIATVDGEAIYGGEPAVYDDAGNRLFAIPYEVLEDSFGAEETGGVGISEIDGYRLEMDFEAYTYTVTEMATGEVVVAGDQDELYRPPRVTITDSAGSVVLDITFEEFYEAEERSYQQRGEEFYPRSEPLVLVSNDGTTWERATLPPSEAPSEGIDVGGVTYGPTGFVLSMNRYGDDSFQSQVLQSSNGRDWQLLNSDRTPRDGPIVTWDGRFFSVSYAGGGRSGVSESSNATDWNTVFEAADRSVHYSSIAAGEFGIVVLGQYQETAAFGPPLRISKEGRTLVLDYGQGTFTVIEDATGEELTVVQVDIWDEEAPEQFVVDDETGTVTILDEQGNELMTITEEEGEAAAEQQQEEFGDVYGDGIPQPAVAFSPDGDTWFTVSTRGLDVAWSQGMAVGENSVVIVGESLDAYREELALHSEGADGVEESPVTTIVTTEDFPGTGPSLRVWVGSRK